MKEVAPGTIIDQRFEVLNEVGQGGMGVVYRARQHSMGRDVALKLLKSNLAGSPDKVSRFQREARIVSRLEHKNIVQIYAVGLANEGQPYIAMEFLTGRQLSDVILEGGPLPWRRAVQYTLQICDALEYAHCNNIIHRDIKPSNVLVCGDDTADGATIKVVDFGIAKSLVESGPALTQTEMVMGSVFYLSPGQFQGRGADTTSDIYSLGCTLFEALVGKPPFMGDTIFDTVRMQTYDALPDVNSVNPKADIPVELQRILDRMTAKTSEERLASPAEVRTYLQKVLRGESVNLAPSKFSAKQSPKRSQKWQTALLGVFASVLLAAAFYHYFTQKQSDGSPKNVYLVGDADEKALVEKIHCLAGAGDKNVLAAHYEELSEYYARARMPRTSYLCALQSAAYATKPHDRVKSGLQAATRLIELGRFDDSTRLLKKVPGLDPTPVELHVIAQAIILSSYAQGKCEVVTELMSTPALRAEFSDSAEDNFAIPFLEIGGYSALASRNYDLANDFITKLESRLSSRAQSDPLRLQAQLLRIEWQKLTGHPSFPAEIQAVLAVVQSNPNLLSLLGMDCAVVAFLDKQKALGLSLIHQTTESAIRRSDLPSNKVRNLGNARMKLDHLQTYLTTAEWTSTAPDREKLTSEFAKGRQRLNDAESQLAVPVPVNDAKVIEDEWLSE